jgi:hypothetical protein
LGPVNQLESRFVRKVVFILTLSAKLARFFYRGTFYTSRSSDMALIPGRGPVLDAAMRLLLGLCGLQEGAKEAAKLVDEKGLKPLTRALDEAKPFAEVVVEHGIRPATATVKEQLPEVAEVQSAKPCISFSQWTTAVAGVARNTLSGE